MSSQDDANLPQTADEYRPDDWLSASETIRRVRTATLSHQADITICTRAHAGMIRTRAQLLMIGQETREEQAIHKKFWWATGHEALKQNWETGDFETWIDKRFHLKAFGVTFHREDIRRMVPSAFPETTASEESRNSGGRSMSRHWPEWVAELVAHVHEAGIPEGVGTKGSEALIDAVATRLAERGLDAPSRSTVQETINAVLRRMRNL